MSPLSTSPAPDHEHSANLNLEAPINPRVTKVLAVVMWHRKRVHLRIEELSSDGQVLEDKHSRMGLVLWRTLILPSLRLYTERHGLEFEVMEVTSSPVALN